MAQRNSKESEGDGIRPAGYSLSDDELRQMQAEQRLREMGVPWREGPEGMARSKARNWYWWLWLSPLLTLPTLGLIAGLDPGFEAVCQGVSRGCNWAAAERITLVIAVLGSALWHLVLLIPALNKERPFVRWHGRQALLLATMRTLVPLGFGWAFGADYGALLFIPVQLVLWLGGTLWGQLQAARGKCSLMRWFGQEELLDSLQGEDEETGPAGTDVEALIAAIRSSGDPDVRRWATAQLKKLGMVEPL